MAGDSVLAIANEFLSRGKRSGEALTHMQLQKLCYLAHGYTLALLHEPLTKDTIEAWDFGPVYPRLYDALKAFGNDPIQDSIRRNNWAMLESIRGEVMRTGLSDFKEGIVGTVFDDYAGYDAFELSALTHEKGTPWHDLYVPGVKNIIIPDDLIEEYFVGLTTSSQ